MAEWLQRIPDTFRVLVSDFGFFDLLDIIIVAWIIYIMMTKLHSTSSARVAKGIVLLLLVTWLSGEIGLDMVRYLLEKTLEVGFLALIIVFQPELRRILERFGASNLKGLFVQKEPTQELEQAIAETVAACRAMSESRTGALIVFERTELLDEHMKVGIQIDARTSEELLKNLFFTNAALHDGAVLIREGRVAAAGCVLPLTSNPNLSPELGTRHRAAIGISEVSDAMAVVVSEETGSVSLAIGGELSRHLALATLEMRLCKGLLQTEDKSPPAKYRQLLNRLQVKKDERKAKTKAK